jgi:hypothetical protein
MEEGSVVVSPFLCYVVIKREGQFQHGSTVVNSSHTTKRTPTKENRPHVPPPIGQPQSPSLFFFPSTSAPRLSSTLHPPLYLGVTPSCLSFLPPSLSPFPSSQPTLSADPSLILSVLPQILVLCLQHCPFILSRLSLLLFVFKTSVLASIRSA